MWSIEVVEEAMLLWLFGFWGVWWEVLGFGVGSCTSEAFVLLQPQLPFAVNTVLRRLFLVEDMNLES